MKDNYNSYC